MAVSKPAKEKWKQVWLWLIKKNNLMLSLKGRTVKCNPEVLETSRVGDDRAT